MRNGRPARVARQPVLRMSSLRGMSLVEVVVATGLVAILLSLAIPNYRQYVIRGYRVAAIDLLLDAARCQERIYVTEFHYDTTRCLQADPAGRYRLRFEPADTVGTMVFSVYADPEGSQQQDACGSLGINQSGARTISGPAETLRQCWAGR